MLSSCLSPLLPFSIFFFFNDTAPTEIYTLPLHDALPISAQDIFDLLPADLSASPESGDAGWADYNARRPGANRVADPGQIEHRGPVPDHGVRSGLDLRRDRKSTRLNSSHANISYAGFCLK